MKASVVIPAYNAFERLNYNLLSLSLQNCARELFEVIIVDNCSTDKTAELVRKYQNSINVKYLYLPVKVTRSHARNAGIAAAAGDIIIFSDSDMISERDYIAKHIEAHNGMNQVICGVNWEKVYTFYYRDFRGYLKKNFLKVEQLYKLTQTYNKLPDRTCLLNEPDIITGKYRNYTFTYSFYDYGYHEILTKYGKNLTDFKFPWCFFVTNNCSVRKEMILNAGMFDEGYRGWGCEDLDLGFRLYKKGCSFTKENIESIHQEHPISIEEDGLKNIYSFSNKYDSVDVLLFYFHHLISLDLYAVNELLKEVEYIQRLEEYKLVLDVFMNLLRTARDISCIGMINKTELIRGLKRLKKNLEDNKDQLNCLYREVEEKHQCHRITSALKLLEKRMFRK